MSAVRPADTDIEAIAQRLDDLRQALGYTRGVDWADHTGIAASAWLNYTRGDRMISLAEALKLCAATGVSLDWIYRGGGHEHHLPAHVKEKLVAYRRGRSGKDKRRA